MSTNRQLAAIMFTDIVGYTALMGKDEDKAFQSLAQFKKIAQPLVENFHGSWHKDLGDGALMSFNNVLDAVHCAIVIQKEINSKADFRLRMGIHLGDVTFKDGDVFGDGVNIASRIQTIARPGSIYISESVYLNVANKKDIQTKFIKEEALKNVREPVKIYEVITTNEPSNSTLKEQSKRSPDKSIAVLPFANMSSDPEQEYFSDGITEEILNSLARIKELKVAGRTSAFQFKGKQTDLREIGRLLNVQTVLEGSIRKQGGQVRITVQLINTEDGFHLWSERFDRELHDIFALQDEIALEVTKKLKTSLTENIHEGVSRTDLVAYDHYLLGRFSLSERTNQSITKAVRCFKNSIESDPGFARAYAGLADSYLIAAIGYATIPGAFELAKEAAEKALALNPKLSEPYVSIGYFYLNIDWNWHAAYNALRKAVGINPNDARAFQWLSQYYLYNRKFRDAIALIQRAREIEPLSALIVTESAWPHLWMGQYDEAIKILQQALTLDNRFALAHYNIADCFENLKEYDKALKEYQLAIEYSGRSPVMVAFYACCLIKTGKIDIANEHLKELLELYQNGASISLFIAFIYDALGDVSETISWLERAIDYREPMIIAINTRWLPFKSIIDNPNFHAILRKLPAEISAVILPSNQGFL